MLKIDSKYRNTGDSEIYEAILKLETVDECMDLFTDLMSPKELHSIEQRYHVARLLTEGCVYSEILEKTGASSATVSRVSRSLRDGGNGYDIVFKRLDNKEEQ